MLHQKPELNEQGFTWFSFPRDPLGWRALSLLSLEDLQASLKHDSDIEAQALIPLIDQIEVSLTRYAYALVSSIRGCTIFTALEDSLLMSAIYQRGQTGDAWSR